MARRYSHREKNELIEVLKVLEEMNCTLQIMDEAPGLVGKYFGCVEDQNEISQVFQEIYAQTQDIPEQRKIGYAFNFAIVDSLFRSGHQQDAKEVLETIAEQEMPLNLINDMISKAGLSYPDLCFNSHKLLSPSELDRIIFDTYAPESRELSQTYHSKGAIAIATLVKRGKYAVDLFNDTCSGQSVKKDGIPFSTTFLGISLGGGVLQIDGDKEKVRCSVQDVFQRSGVKDYNLVFTNTPEIADYLKFRLLIKNIGTAVNVLTPLRNKPSHRIIGK